MEIIQNFDFAVLDGIQNALRCDFLDTIIPVLTHLGHGVIWTILGWILIFTKKYRFNGISIITALTVTVIISEFIIKPLFLRERPYMLNPDFVLLIPEPSGTSFPSSHTSTSFASALQFFGINRKAGIAAMIFAAVVAFTRLYLYVHFPTDILGGIVLGLIMGFAVMFIAKKIRNNLSERTTV
ncbi:MAG: phosphatase PAP2 family protein [Ruminiclostridium sp.]|nr:phosphatase PAP2 family protein [Ruminiclostridium sp.]